MLRLSSRDVAILLALYRYRYLRSTHIHELVGGSATTLRWRLRELFDAALVARPPRQWEAANALYVPAVYELTVAGVRRLQDFDVLSPGATSHHGVRSDGHFMHSLLVSQVMVGFELGVRAIAGLSLIGEDEILGRLAGAHLGHLNPRSMPVGSNRFVIPDGLFGIRSPRGVVLYALELDRGHEPLTRRGIGSTYKAKFAAYHELIARGRYRELLATPAPLLVLHLTTSDARVRAMAKLAGSDQFHLFRKISAREDVDAYLREPWFRPNHTGFQIATATVVPLPDAFPTL